MASAERCFGFGGRGADTAPAATAAPTAAARPLAEGRGCGGCGAVGAPPAAAPAAADRRPGHGPVTARVRVAEAGCGGGARRPPLALVGERRTGPLRLAPTEPGPARSQARPGTAASLGGRLARAPDRSARGQQPLARRLARRSRLGSWPLPGPTSPSLVQRAPGRAPGRQQGMPPPAARRRRHRGRREAGSGCVWCRREAGSGCVCGGGRGLVSARRPRRPASGVAAGAPPLPTAGRSQILLPLPVVSLKFVGTRHEHRITRNIYECIRAHPSALIQDGTL